LKKDLRKASRKKSTQRDPLYDKLSDEAEYVINNRDVTGEPNHKFQWTKDDEKRLNALNANSKSLQSRREWT